MSYSWMEIIDMPKFKPETVEKHSSSTIGPPGGIERTPLRCRCNALTSKLRTTTPSSQRHGLDSCWRSQ